jgi:hypothetical protein
MRSKKAQRPFRLCARASSPVKNDMLIEVFRAGSPAAIAAGITAADLADVAAFDCANNPVPNVIGHPATDSPACAAVRSFKVEGNKLFADVPEAHPNFAPIVAGIKGQSILNRSMGFFGKRHPSNPTPGKLAPKHLGFLGGAAPGVAGMPPLASYFAANPDTSLAFAADGVTLEISGDPMDAVVFDAAPEPATGVVVVTDTPPAATPAPTPAAPAATEETTMTPEQIAAKEAELKAREEAAEAREKQFAADAKAARESANASTVEALITSGKVLPADKADLVAAFNAVDGGEVIAFAADATKKASPVAIIAGILAKGGKVTPAGEGQQSSTEDNAEFSADSGKVAELDKVRAERLARYGK